MLPTYAYYIVALVSSAVATPLVARDTCWTGNIHSPCNGAAAGCTPDGILVSGPPMFVLTDWTDTLSPLLSGDLVIPVY